MPADPKTGIAAAKRSAASITPNAIAYVRTLPKSEGGWTLSVEHGRIIARADGCNVVVMMVPLGVSGDGA
jgi:hypothetical protein